MLRLVRRSDGGVHHRLPGRCIRTEEARALAWQDIDTDNQVMIVRRSVRSRGQLKTRTSLRSLPLDHVALRALQRRKRRHCPVAPLQRQQP